MPIQDFLHSEAARYFLFGVVSVFIYYILYLFCRKSHLAAMIALLSCYVVGYYFNQTYGVALFAFFVVCAIFDRVYHNFLRTGGGRHIPKVIKQKVRRQHGGKCNYCGSKNSLEYDHIFPFSLGGRTEIKNLQLLCFQCNRKKGKKVYWF